MDSHRGEIFQLDMSRIRLHRLSDLPAADVEHRWIISIPESRDSADLFTCLVQ